MAPQLAMISVLPLPTAVTRPSSLTSAIISSSLRHVSESITAEAGCANAYS